MKKTENEIYDSFPPELKALAQEYGTPLVAKAVKTIGSVDSEQIKNLLDANRRFVQEQRLKSSKKP